MESTTAATAMFGIDDQNELDVACRAPRLEIPEFVSVVDA